MEKTTGKSRSSGKRFLPRAVILSLAAGAALAAALFIANNQPWGYVAPPALSGVNVSKGNVVAYTPWFEVGSFRGDLLALPVATTGDVANLAPLWRASPVLDGQHFSTGRRIVTTDGAGAGIPFRIPALQTAGVNLTPLGPAPQAMLDYVRGDRSNEGAAGFRMRNGVLGDIIHSGPVYVGKPASGYNFGGYLTFANANAARAPRVYVGANDGMLHAFDARTGGEVYAYVPSMVMANLPKLAAQPYKHQYYVDGRLTVEDAQFGGAWHSVLVGGLGAGGRGYYALDVTSGAVATEAQAAGKILWEFHSGSAGAGNLGYSYSRPSIVRMNNGAWAAVVGNGYLSGSGVASLYFLDIRTGAVIREIAVPDINANGLSSPTLIDYNGDGMVDLAYAGDLNGNLWRFDLMAASPAAWGVAYGEQPLFQTALIGGVRQAITTAPEVGRHPDSGLMVYIGTGRLLSIADGTDKTTQAAYGIWDNNWAAGVPIDPALLLAQQLKGVPHASGTATRVATNNQPNWSAHRGWVTPMLIAAATSLDQGERVIQDLMLRDGRVSLMAVNPTIPTGDNWFIQLDATTGGAPRKTIIDVNTDLLLNVADNVDGNGDGVVADVPEDRVVGQYQNFGLASRPVAGVLSAGKDVALINHLVAVTPIPPGVVGDPLDPGLLGGHFDLDTSHLTYPFNGGQTDGHVHQWDDKHNLTTIDFFALPDGNGNPLYEVTNNLFGVQPNETFILTVANDALSPGGILEINGSSVSVGDYRALLDRYLSGTLNPGETFPRYKLDNPTKFEQLAGVQRLSSLKLSFDAFAIISGDLLPTETGCVKSNTPGALGEYRNGALMVQALEASGITSGFTFDPATQRYVAGTTAIQSPLGYATDGLLWEATVFWHWEGPCYHDALWAPLYDSCVVQGLGGCTKASEEEKKKGKKKKKKDDDDDDDDEDKKDESPPPGDPPPPAPPIAESDPDHSVTNTTIGGDNDTGRMFWREVIPEE